MIPLRRSVSLFRRFAIISMLAVSWHSFGGEGILKRKEKKREELAFLFTQVVLVKLHPDLLQVAFLFGEESVLDFKFVVTEPSSREEISDEITASAMAVCWSPWAFSMPCGVWGSVMSIGVPGSEEIGSGEGTWSSGIMKPSASSLRGLSRSVGGVGALGAALRSTGAATIVIFCGSSMTSRSSLTPLTLSRLFEAFGP